MQNKTNMKKRISPQMVAAIGSIILIIGGFFLSNNYIKKKKMLAYDYITNIFYEENKEIIEHDGNINYEEQNEFTDDIIGYLTIPKINLRKGFYDIRSKNNDVDKNIFIVEGSNYPDKNKGNFIIAGHSGNAWNSFFDNLYKLSKDDKLEVTYKGKKYIYKIVNIYKQPKVGKIAIYRNYDKTNLTLVTCTNHDSKTQTIYIAELEKKE